MCIQYLHHGSSIVELALSLSSHSPILMNMMLGEKPPPSKESKNEVQKGQKLTRKECSNEVQKCLDDPHLSL